jgi:hypothetical protein
VETKQTLALIALLILLLGPSARVGHTETNTPADLQVTILDDNGSLVHSAHIYIFSENKKEFFGTREAHGTSAFDLPAGDYRIYAAMMLKTDDMIDHLASPEATVHIDSYEPTSVILGLQRADNSEMVLSDTARQKMGISEELASNLN